ncbi:MAG: hypothetical protein QME74_00520 [Candidatus Edwardsbacteria bacterium]|nr:hypothetical protein [Candidatus Edwardsbacteria bacterium]
MKDQIIIVALLALASVLVAQTPTPTDTVKPVSNNEPGEIIIREVPAVKPVLVDTIVPAAKVKVDRKSIKKALFMSLAVPGAGEYYVGSKKYAAGFLTAEGLIWTFALVSKFQGEMWKRDYRNYAAQQAGANFARDDDNYYRDIYEYPNSDWYNEDQWRQAREQYPNDPAAQAAFVSGRLYSSDDAWRWQSAEQWNSFRSLRVKSRTALQRISYAAGSALLNHLLSGVNAARLARGYNKRPVRKAEAFGWRLDVARDGGDFQIRLVGNF